MALQLAIFFRQKIQENDVVIFKTGEFPFNTKNCSPETKWTVSSIMRKGTEDSPEDICFLFNDSNDVPPGLEDISVQRSKIERCKLKFLRAAGNLQTSEQYLNPDLYDSANTTDVELANQGAAQTSIQDSVAQTSIDINNPVSGKRSKMSTLHNIIYNVKKNSVTKIKYP